jgi:hypothetical protein
VAQTFVQMITPLQNSRLHIGLKQENMASYSSILGYHPSTKYEKHHL